jgi:hypothetical protein
VGAAAVEVGRLGGSGPAQELGRKAFFFSDYFKKLFYFVFSFPISTIPSYYMHTPVLPTHV